MSLAGRTTLILFGCAAAATMFLSAHLSAQEQPLPWMKNNHGWDFGVFVAGATGEETTNSFAQAQIWTAGAFAARRIGQTGTGWRAGTWEYGFSLIPLFYQTRIQDLYGGGFEPVIFRFNSNHALGRAAPYLEVGGGAVVTTANLPPGNTSSFNFSARGGGGFQFIRHPNQSLDLGCRWYHVSNANLGIQNPEFNSIQVSFSYHWFK